MGLLATNAPLYLLGHFLGVHFRRQTAKSKGGNGHWVLLTLGIAVCQKTLGVVTSELKSAGLLSDLTWPGLGQNSSREKRLRLGLLCEIRGQKTRSGTPALPPAH